MQLTHSNYGRYRQSADRAVRQGAVTALPRRARQYQRALAATLAGQLELVVADARARGWSALGLHGRGRVATAVLRQSDLHGEHEITAMHRYVGASKRALDLPEVHLYDLYMPLTEGVEGLSSRSPRGGRRCSTGPEPLGKE